ncbi:hypothetical protein [Dactylosporangium sp. CA-092794]|uniref:hypothetical protein n=1 Tax=Dactylosporangium sp. CA-092794 TaxID=3239929 RepID=UPI003D9339A6
MTVTTTASTGGLMPSAAGPPPFAHPLVTARPPINDTTRRLCAAAYLDDDYAYRVIEETTGDDQRAVPPSLGFDVEPVVRHSFRARGMLLLRDGLLTLVLVAAFVLLPFATIGWLSFAFGLRQLRRARRLRRAGLRADPQRAAWGAIAGSVVLYCCGAQFSPLLLLLQVGSDATTQAGSSYDQQTTGGNPIDDLAARVTSAYNTSLVLLVAGLPILFALATLGVALGARIRTFRSLTRTLGPAAPGTLPPLPGGRIERRVAWLAAAQRGNVSLHSKNPLMGAGDTVMFWSMAVLLQGLAVRGAARPGETGERFSRDTTFDPRSVSALALQRSISAAILRLQEAGLPPHQRVPGVYVMDRIIADGERYQGDPLIDQATRTPLQMASPDAVAAIVEQPQGGVRHYLHVIVGVDGREVRLSDGRVALPAQSQDIVISAFVHVAIEGGKLYLEFLGAVLPPLRDDLRVVDRLRPELGRLLQRAVPGLMSDWLHSVAAPGRMLRTLRQMVSTKRRARRAREDATEFKSYEHGARLCVRELAAESEVRTFMQDLDAKKYLKLVERTVLDTVLDYLERAGVDTSEYRMQMNIVQNTQNTFNSPTFNGPAAIGAGAFAQQVGPQQAGALV